jgi:hypothetical protein
MYRIDKRYCWYNRKEQVVLMYFINSIPFTFDDLSKKDQMDNKILELADNERMYEPEDLYKSSFYLIDEEVHPLLFEVDVENPEDLPQDDYYEFEEEDLTN